MARKVHSEADNLDWTVRRLWVAEAVRPHGMQPGPVGAWEDIGVFQRGTANLLSPIVALLFAVPTMLVLVPLRAAGLAAWEIEARTRPWGRYGPVRSHRWRIKGSAEAKRLVDEIADALERGEQPAQIAPAHRLR